MKRLVLGSLLLVTNLFASLPVARAEETDVWLNRLDQAASMAREQHKPLMVVFRCER